MTWKYLPLIYRVLSPMHIGFRSVGIIDRTRYYVPAKNFWAAVTSSLTSKLCSCPKASDYRFVGDAIQMHLRFTYFYLATMSSKNTSSSLRFYLPEYKRRRTRYLKNPKREQEYIEANIESLFIGSYISTSLDYARYAAMDTMLHEIEFIKPHVLDHGEVLDTYLVGGVWVNSGNDKGRAYVQIDESNVLIDGISILDQLAVGGERGYGFGRIEVTDVRTDCLGFGSWETEEEDKGGLTVVPPDQQISIPAHVKYETGQKYEGLLEPIVGREWDEKKGAGRSIAKGIVCLAPGGRCNASSYEIDGRGFWKSIA